MLSRLHLRPLLGLLVGLLWATAAAAQVQIHATTARPAEYARIRQLISGPGILYDAPQDQDAHGFYYRLLLVTSEIYDRVLVERVEFGVEGCCETVLDTRELRWHAFTELQGDPTGLMTGIRLLGAVTPTDFRLWIDGREYVVADVDTNQPTVRPAD